MKYHSWTNKYVSRHLSKMMHYWIESTYINRTEVKKEVSSLSSNFVLSDYDDDQVKKEVEALKNNCVKSDRM